MLRLFAAQRCQLRRMASQVPNGWLLMLGCVDVLSSADVAQTPTLKINKKTEIVFGAERVESAEGGESGKGAKGAEGAECTEGAEGAEGPPCVCHAFAMRLPCVCRAFGVRLPCVWRAFAASAVVRGGCWGCWGCWGVL